MKDDFDKLLDLDALLVGKGFPGLSPFWRKTLRSFLRSGKRALVVRAGRRGGKSLVLSKLALACSLFGTWAVSPGEVGTACFISVDRDEAGSRLRTVGAMLDALGEKYVRRGDEIELLSRPCVFRVLTATSAGVVGRNVIFAAADEVARWRDSETGANPAREVIASLTPSMLTQASARLYLASSPWMAADFHAEKFDQGDDASQMVAFAPTWVAHPGLTEAMCRALEPDPRIFSREYLGIPVEAVAAVCSADELTAVTGTGERHPRIPGASYVLTIDAGLKYDAFAATVAHRVLVEGPNGGTFDRITQDAILHLQPKLLRPVKLADACEQVAKLAFAYGVTKVYGDGHYSEAIGPMLAEKGIKLVVLPMASGVITARVQNFQARLASGGIELLRHEAQKKEILQAQLVHHTGPGNRITLRAPERRGAHDDLLSALLLALDADTTAKLPYSDGGEIVVRYARVHWDAESRQLSGGGASYFRPVNGKLMPREPPIGTQDFEEYARAEVAAGRWTDSIIRFVTERYGAEHVRPDTDLDALDATTESLNATIYDQC